MPTDFVDISNEILEVEREANHLAAALDRATEAPRDAQATWERTLMLGSGVEKVYSGCERVMSRIAVDIDGAKIGNADGWHATLLLRMARPFPDVRDVVLSAEAYTLLDDLRSFRHRERNSYGFNLNPVIVQDRARQAVQAFLLFKSQVMRFLEQRSRPA